jgi:hypothetical protein
MAPLPGYMSAAGSNARRHLRSARTLLAAEKLFMYRSCPCVDMRVFEEYLALNNIIRQAERDILLEMVCI